MTAKSVACANMKGGVGKSTIAVSLAEGSAFLGRRALLVDADVQLNASTVLVSPSPAGLEPWKIGKTIDDYIRQKQQGEEPNVQSFITNIGEGLDLLSGKLTILQLERELLAGTHAVYQAAINVRAWIDDLINSLKPHYDLVIFDTPPGLSIITECVLSAVDLVVLPQIPDRLSTQGIEVYASYLINTVGLSAIGKKTIVVVNMCPPRLTKIAESAIKRIVQDAGRGAFPYRLFEQQYRDLVAFRQAMGRDRPDRFEKLWAGVEPEVLAATRELWQFLDRPINE